MQSKQWQQKIATGKNEQYTRPIFVYVYDRHFLIQNNKYQTETKEEARKCFI